MIHTLNKHQSIQYNLLFVICLEKLKIMSSSIIAYFRTNLKNKLPRPMCGRFLPLWDETKWVKRPTEISLNYIEANEFLVFLFQTKKDTCCHTDVAAQSLTNAIDKFFFLMFDFQSFFNVFIQNKLYKHRLEVLQDIYEYKTKNIVPRKLFTNTKFLELFIDLSKRIGEWDFWRRQVIINFVKIFLGKDVYNSWCQSNTDYLQKYINNVEQLFFVGLNEQK